MATNEEMANMISALAGAAQSGATGTLARAALNIMMASEAITRLRNMEADDPKLKKSLLEGAEQALKLSHQTFHKAAQLPQVIEEAKQDIVNAKGIQYQPEELKH